MYVCVYIYIYTCIIIYRPWHSSGPIARGALMVLKIFGAQAQLPAMA